MKALDLSKYIVNLCLDNNKPVSNLQLQKILYLSHLFHIIKTKENLIEDGNIFEAWRLGPVIPKVYYKYSIYAGAPIIPFDEERVNPNNIFSKEREIKKIEIVRKLIINLSAASTWKLVELTHKKGGAWDKTFRDGKGNREIISSNLIKQEVS